MTADSKQLARTEVNTAERVSTRVVAHLCVLIDSGELQPGDQLPPERELARRMKVSRASLRTGIAFLGIIGVLKSFHGSGTYVSLGTPTPWSNGISMPGAPQNRISSQLFEARSLIEEAVVGLAAERSTSKHLAELAEEVAEMYGALNDPGRYSIHDVRFHRTIARAAGNAILGALLETLTANVYDSRPLRARSPRNLRQVAEVHREIYRAIRARNPSRAKILMQQLSIGTSPCLEDEAGACPPSI
jgi:GntR family transcriptional regulator, transcriptional repressor for pyruvate dehydrogenase complex